MVLKKLALVTAMLAATSGAFAMEAMDEEALAATTGQDGITINLSTSASVDVIIHDGDGFVDPQGVAANDRTNSGAILLNDIVVGSVLTAGVVSGNAAVKIDVDAGSSADNATDATLNIGVTLGTAGATPVNTVIDLGTLRVANSNREADVGWGVEAGSGEGTVLVNLGQLTIGGGTKLNIQLGNEAQGDMIAFATTMSNGLSLSNVSLNDSNSGGAISVGTLSVTDAGLANGNLAIDLGINATATGLSIRVDTLGTGGMDITMANVKIGGATAASIGDVEINGLDMTNDVITISGH